MRLLLVVCCVCSWLLVSANPINAQPKAKPKKMEWVEPEPEPEQKIPALSLPQELADIANQIFESIKAEDSQKAFSVIQMNSHINMYQKKGEMSKATIDALLKKIGKCVSYELNSAEQISPMLVKARYVSYHEESPAIWDLVYYKPPEGKWIILNSSVSDNVLLLFPPSK